MERWLSLPVWLSIWGMSVPSHHTGATGLSLFLGSSFSEGWQPSSLRGSWDLQNEFWGGHLTYTLSQIIPNMSCKLLVCLCSVYLWWGSSRQKPASYLLFVFYLISVFIWVLWDKITCMSENGEGAREGQESHQRHAGVTLWRGGRAIQEKPFKPIHSPGLLLQHRAATITFFGKSWVLWQRSHSLVGTEPGR